ncbi:tetratricopeptide repeat protein [Streptomyces sp. NPDC050546]|uniref:tetratricopeptide repeat protein n=1 Tax=Streptomyces sp. NPDC050546 TaxID=3365628 RepID=UPI0037B37075
MIRQRTRARFVGRRAQLSLFAENLGRDPYSEEDPAEFLFHVRGVGGVGKSTLLRQWQEAARRAGAVTAVVDEGDVHGVQQALSELARQLAAQAGPLKEYDRAAEQYRREQEAAVEPVPAEGDASVSSRVVAQAALGAVSLIPGAAPVAAMASPDAAAQGLDRLRSGARTRPRRARASDAAEVSRAFVSELGRLCGRHPWVVLFLDTWEVTGRYLDGWLRDLLEDAFGPLPVNVMVVLAGRDELAEREWAPLRALVADVPLDVFTVAETRALLAARGVTEPDVVEAVLQLSMGLPLLVELLAFTRPAAAEDVAADGNVADLAVERFVQWITDGRQRETVLACAFAPQLNEDIFATAVPAEARQLWQWLCEQPFVSGRGDFKQYHAVVRASMVRQQRAHSPQRWTTAHVRLADAHAAWRAAAEQGLPEAKRWGDPRWRRHRLDETYHRLCAHPAAELPATLEEAVHAAGQDAEILRQWIDGFAQAARDSADPALLTWAERLQSAAADAQPLLAALAALLAHGGLDISARAWVHAYRGRQLYLADRDDEATQALDLAVATDPRNARAWAYRGDLHRWLDHSEQAISDLTTALTLDPTDAWSLARRGEANGQAGRNEEAVADLTAALALDPTMARALASRGEVHRAAARYGEAMADFTDSLGLDAGLAADVLPHRALVHSQAGRHDAAVADFTAALEIDPTYAWARAQRGLVHTAAGRHEEAVADFTAALELDGTLAWALAERGVAHRAAGRTAEAVTDLTAAAELDPPYAWALAQRGETHRLDSRYDLAVDDFTAAMAINPSYSWALSHRGEAHREAGRFEEAVTDFTAALDIDAASMWTLASRGQAHREAGRLDEAVADLSAALEADPTLDWALAERGQAHRQAGRFEEAVADFTAALALDPAYVWALARRGEVYRQAGRFEEAVADLSAVLEGEPRNDWVLAERGAAHRQAGRFEEAVADFTAALAVDPGYVWALVSRGQAHRQAGRFEEAVADFTAALALDPAYVWALARRGEAFRQAGRFEEAVADLSAVLEGEPRNDWVLAERGAAHRQAGRFEEAVADFTAALAVDPGYVWALVSRGQAHRQAGRFEEAVADFTAALALDPVSSWALSERGQTHREAGRLDEAIADFTAALEHDPTLVEALAERGEAHRQTGRHEEAVADFTAALEHDPDLSWALERRGIARREAGHYALARQDLEQAIVAEPGDRGVLFEQLMLDTVTSGFEACRDRWAALLEHPVDTPGDDATRYFALFRALLLDTEGTGAEALRTFLDSGPDFDAVTDLLLYLAELSEGDGTLAEHAERSRRLVLAHTGA